MSGVIIGVDPSLRSTGVVAIDLEGNLVGQALVRLNGDRDNEALLLWNCEQVFRFCNEVGWREGSGYQGDTFLVKGVAFEKPSFNSKSADKDKLWGNTWSMRVYLHNKWPWCPIGSIAIESWRSKVLTATERKEWKKQKNGLKLGCVSKLPVEVRDNFEAYLSKLGVPRKKDSDPLWDLCDGYWIARYRLSLET